MRLTANSLDFAPDPEGAWYAFVVGIARQVNAEAAAAAEPAPPGRVSDERVQEIIDGLNAFVVHEYEHSSDVVYGRAVHSSVIVSTDANLDHAVAWAREQDDVVDAAGPVLGNANVQLRDGTLIEYESERHQWTVTVSDDTEAPGVGS
jgi:hypothetical protein